MKFNLVVFCVTTQVLLVYLIQPTLGGHAEIIGKEEYKEKLIKNITTQIEETGVTGNAFQIEDFTTNITANFYDNVFDGNCTFFDGCVVRIEEITGPHYESHLSYDSANQTHITLDFDIHFLKVHILYYLDFTFPDYHDAGAMEFLFDFISFKVKVVNEIETGNKTGSFIKYYTSSGDYQIAVRGYPYHQHMQVIASLKAKYKDMIRQSFGKWTILETFFEKAIQEEVFPEICYNCPDKKKL